MAVWRSWRPYRLRRSSAQVLVVFLSSMLALYFLLPWLPWRRAAPMRFDQRIACYGPRGKVLSNSPDDELRSVKLKICVQMPQSDLPASFPHSLGVPSRA